MELRSLLGWGRPMAQIFGLARNYRKQSGPGTFWTPIFSEDYVLWLFWPLTAPNRLRITASGSKWQDRSDYGSGFLQKNSQKHRFFRVHTSENVFLKSVPRSTWLGWGGMNLDAFWWILISSELVKHAECTNASPHKGKHRGLSLIHIWRCRRAI